ncbi:hypothetical protein CARUB_v10015770mg [Capsella rubella]|uniref:F-box domain-containing protein n=1 Tax=Capsella rubella TaxID=81985 RepID=R0I3J5_9BRAS|nr:putative F-box protein At3g23950 [Capsella rubella]EOA32490.1 hypothetical protein CARUB_v10015770mg [Capsella rubella]
MNIPEVALEVLARLSLKDIARSRSVCKEWKLLMDSDFFRDHFISLNSSSVSWSIIQTRPHKLTLEILSHHGCKTWALTRSPGSLVSFFAETAINKLLVLACTDGLVLVYAEASDGTPMYYIGNPLFQEWLQIPHPDFLSGQLLVAFTTQGQYNNTGLVTKMQSGIVVSYKVVLLIAPEDNKVGFATYSSNTGMWEIQTVTCLEPHSWFCDSRSISLNGILHWFSNLNTSFIAYDFYGGHASANVDDKCCIIPFPDSGKGYELPRFRKTITTSEGSIVYFNDYGGNRNNTLRVWRLVKYTDVGPDKAWQLFWQVKLDSSMMDLLGIDYIPVVMHPLNFEIIYLWSMNKKGMVLFNLRTKVFTLHKEAEDARKCMDGCVLSFDHCNEYMDKICGYFFPWLHSGCNRLIFSQFVLPRWFHRLPRPQVLLNLLN